MKHLYKYPQRAFPYGWTGLIAWLIMSRAVLKPAEVLEKGFDAVATKITRSS
jgi:hypothetical protein